MSRLGRRVLAALVGVVVLGVGGLAWLFGRAQYLNDYCFTRAPLPPGVTEGSSVRGPFFESPVSLRCNWAAHPDVVVTDAAPLLGLLLVVLLALAAALLVLLVRAPRSTST